MIFTKIDLFSSFNERKGRTWTKDTKAKGNRSPINKLARPLTCSSGWKRISRQYHRTRWTGLITTTRETSTKPRTKLSVTEGTRTWTPNMTSTWPPPTLPRCSTSNGSLTTTVTGQFSNHKDREGMYNGRQLWQTPPMVSLEDEPRPHNGEGD